MKTSREKWEQEQTEYSFRAFYYQRKYVANIIKSPQRHCYCEKTAKNVADFKAIFNITNHLLHRDQALLLPPSDNKQQLTNEFNKFFITKIDKVMDNLVPTDNSPIDNQFIEKDYLTNLSLNNFTPVTTEDVITSLNKSLTKLCELDPLPTSLLKRVGEDLAPSPNIIYQ